MAKTASQFDHRVEKRRQRPIGICDECGREKELRQRDPEPLCGACLENLRRAETKANDPAAARKSAMNLEKKIRSEMIKLLNVADALEGLVPTEDVNALRAIAKHNLTPIIVGLDGGGHGHE